MPYAVPSRRPSCLAAAAAAMLLAGVLASAPAWAQATAEQQQACAPDAIRLCSDTIPDIAKTTACMKAHVANLSPRCRTAFNEAVGGGTAKATAPRRALEARTPRVATRVERPRPVASLPARRAPRAATLGRLDRTPTASLPPVSTVPGLTGYRANIARLCGEGLVDPFTCRNTFDALNLIQ